MPKLVSAAIKFKPRGCDYFQIMCGKRHCDVLEMMYKLGIEYEKLSATQGFLTEEDQFLDRYDSALAAYYSGQLPRDNPSWKKIASGEMAVPLFSEDVW